MTDETYDKVIEILLVEDNSDDVVLTREALKEGKIKNKLNVARDGIEAIEYLRNKGKFVVAKRPDLIILDLNLPRKNGKEVLAEIKEDAVLKRIPVAVLTTSHSEEDVIKAYDLHANCYITKPFDLTQFVKVIKSVEEFWFSIVKLPK